MNARTALRIGLLVWTIAFILSFIDFGMTEPTSDGFTAGLNKIAKFALWQGISLVVSIVVWVIGTRFEPRSGQRIASRIPGVVMIAIAIAFGLFILSSGLIGGLAGGPEPDPRAPVTEPVQ
ncbi:MAG: hypothetical protein VX874_21700 [Pseudomonadota bacterium]|nr:hypothetical protein [Pseudomonadota bacterium]